MIRTVLWCQALAGVSLVIGLWHEFILPDVVPIHWGADGQPDAFGSPGLNLFVFPGLIAALPLLLVLAARLSRRQEHVARSWPAISTIVIAISACLTGVHLFILRSMANPDVPVSSTSIFAMLGLLWIVLGNVMPKLRSQGFAGIRTPWTLGSDKVWHQTHRLAGWCFAIGGLAAVLVSLLGPAEPSIPGMLSLFLAPAVIPVVYSYFAWKNLPSDATEV